MRYAGAGVLALGAAALIFIGQPTTGDKWQALSPTKAPLLTERTVQIPPVELLGGVNGWLDTFASADPALPEATASLGDDRLRYKFALALGAKSPAATPDPHRFILEYTPKIQLKLKRGPAGGGCG